MQNMRTSLPLVSVLIPAYNRRDYLELALKSVLHQTYPNIEIIVSDDSTNLEVEEMITPYLQRYPQIKYSKNTEKGNNFNRCLQLSSGKYINYLMDDDLFQESKIEKMMEFFLNCTEVRLVTSAKSVINESGLEIATWPSGKMFKNDFILDGKLLGNDALKKCSNVIGEPTTVLFKKEHLGETFGQYKGRKYTYLNDLASWMSLLSKGKAIFLKEKLSCFRVHPNQNQRNPEMMALGIIEWYKLIKNSRKDGFIRDDEDYKTALESYIKVSSSLSRKITKLNASHLLDKHNTTKYIKKCKAQLKK